MTSNGTTNPLRTLSEQCSRPEAQPLRGSNGEEEAHPLVPRGVTSTPRGS